MLTLEPRDIDDIVSVLWFSHFVRDLNKLQQKDNKIATANRLKLILG